MVVLDLGRADAFRADVQLPDERIVAGGVRTSPRGDSDMFLAVLRPDGELDSTVGTAGLLSFDAAGGPLCPVPHSRVPSIGQLRPEQSMQAPEKAALNVPAQWSPSPNAPVSR